MSIVGTLDFDYPIVPWQYTDVQTELITVHKLVTDIFASGTNNKIGNLFIDTQVQKQSNGNYTGQAIHTYVFPEGSFQCQYLKESMTPQGFFKPNSSTYGTVVSGSGNFLGSIGVIRIDVVDNIPIRKVHIVFSDKEVYPLPN